MVNVKKELVLKLKLLLLQMITIQDFLTNLLKIVKQVAARSHKGNRRKQRRERQREGEVNKNVNNLYILSIISSLKGATGLEISKEQHTRLLPKLRYHLDETEKEIKQKKKVLKKSKMKTL